MIIGYGEEKRKKKTSKNISRWEEREIENEKNNKK